MLIVCDQNNLSPPAWVLRPDDDDDDDGTGRDDSGGARARGSPGGG